MKINGIGNQYRWKYLLKVAQNDTSVIVYLIYFLRDTTSSA